MLIAAGGAGSLRFSEAGGLLGVVSGVSGRVEAGRRRQRGAVALSGDEGDAPVGVEELACCGPAVENSHDVLAGSAHDPGGRVP